MESNRIRKGYELVPYEPTNVMLREHIEGLGGRFLDKSDTKAFMNFEIGSKEKPVYLRVGTDEIVGKNWGYVMFRIAATTLGGQSFTRDSEVQELHWFSTTFKGGQEGYFPLQEASEGDYFFKEIPILLIPTLQTGVGEDGITTHAVDDLR
jgi:hypothetical protein